MRISLLHTISCAKINVSLSVVNGRFYDEDLIILKKKLVTLLVQLFLDTFEL